MRTVEWELLKMLSKVWIHIHGAIEICFDIAVWFVWLGNIYILALGHNVELYFPQEFVYLLVEDMKYVEDTLRLSSKLLRTFVQAPRSC